ncbi:MAG: phytochelatin synthase family protein [Betaproteobacteria bacterium]|nr:phytochelatin synthase family protein [Betaproteobacteria bacterium]
MRMQPLVRQLLVAAGSTLLLVVSGVAWYALSSPPVENLPLAEELVGIASPEGQRLLASSASRVDHAQLAPYLVAQERRAFCGPATVAAVVNAALQPKPPVTQASVFNEAATSVKSEFALTLAGLTLEELAGFFRAHRLNVRVVHADRSDISSFRNAAAGALAESGTFLVVNYDRRVLKQSGAGHISPVGAFDGTTDRVLILDVATQKYPYTWVPLSTLWTAMNTVDPDSRQARGYLLVSAGIQSRDDAPR